MTQKMRWLRCEVPFDEAGAYSGALVEEMAKRYALAGAPAGVAVYQSMMFADPVSVWLTEKAADFADETSVRWRHRLVDDDAPPPQLGNVTKLLGQEPELTDILWDGQREQ